jgi:diguanylate cyclase (GGDEF)-like protein
MLQGETVDGSLKINVSGHLSPLESWLFPRLSSARQIGGARQLLKLSINRQLGYDDIDKVACLIALVLSLTLLTIMLFGVSSYARFLEGRQEREMRLFYLANHDRLTNLANRNLFFDRLHHAISRLNRNGRKLAVLFLDMDRFKPVNDTYGHAAGDRVLQLIATRLKLELRVEDTVARLGGDEFVVLLEDVESKDEVNMVVERLKRAIEAPYDVGEQRISLGVSIGVAYYPDDGVLIEELLQVADRKMYGDKNDLSLTV